MKLISYLLRPLKYMFFILVILSLIYFRNVIFLPNITQTVDSAQTYIEKELDISIPVYVNENIVNPIADQQVDPAEIDTDLCNNSNVDESDTVALSVDNSTIKDVVSDSTPIKNSNLSTVKELSKEVTVKEVVNDANNTLAELDLLTQLTKTVNTLNTKVDKLFDEGKLKVEAVLDSNDINQEKIEAESIKSSADNVIPVKNAVQTEDDNKNVHLTEDAKQMFYMARQSYWMGNALAAENIYLQLADIEDDNPDIYGELGNVYYTQGKWSEAGKAYYEAAVRLIDLDKKNQVDYLLRVIEGLDSASAEKLKQKISS